MATYFIGDVQGCDAALGRLLTVMDFSPSRDQLFFLGDLVNRGPDNLGVLRRIRALEGSARVLLGNHDLHLLAVAAGVRAASAQDTLDDVLQDPERSAWLDWLRQQALAIEDQGLLMVHAGVLPEWSVAQTLALAQEVQAVLAGPDWQHFLRQMYGNTPDRWDPHLTGVERWRLTVNALTRLRYCHPDGRMDFLTKEGVAQAPSHLLPWFDLPHRVSRGTPILFGHWSTLNPMARDDVVCLDDGCVWGGCLSALERPAMAQPLRDWPKHQVRGEAAQTPG